MRGCTDSFGIPLWMACHQMCECGGPNIIEYPRIVHVCTFTRPSLEHVFSNGMCVDVHVLTGDRSKSFRMPFLMSEDVVFDKQIPCTGEGGCGVGCRNAVGLGHYTKKMFCVVDDT